MFGADSRREPSISALGWLSTHHLRIDDGLAEAGHKQAHHRLNRPLPEIDEGTYVSPMSNADSLVVEAAVSLGGFGTTALVIGILSRPLYHGSSSIMLKSSTTS